MPHNPHFIEQRNEYIRVQFRAIRKKNPKWTIIAVIEQVAQDVWLSPATVGKVLKTTHRHIPATKTICKNATHLQPTLF